MNSFKIANAINSIGDDLILEADEAVKAVFKKPICLKYAAAAAALVCAAGGAAAIAKTRALSTIVDGNNSHVIKMSDINFNETFTGLSQNYSLDLSCYDSVLLNSEGIIEYFGWDLVPKYIPEGLFPSEWNNSSRIYSDKDDGKIVHDRTELLFYDGYNEYDGSPKCTEYEAPKGFDLIASKLGKLDICVIHYPHEEMTASSINGTDVYFAHFSIRLGNASNLRGYHHRYVAEFELDGISYRVITEQLEAEEIVKIVSSIICGEDFTVEE